MNADSRATQREEPTLDLLLRAISGERDAVGELTGMFLPRVYGLCLRILRRQTLAEDATQETFVRALKALPRLRSPDCFTGWILVIASNTAKEVLRKEPQEQALGSEPIAPASAEASKESDSKKLALDHALRELPVEERALFLLHSVEGVSQEQLARKAGKSIPAIKSRLHRIRAKVRVTAHGFLSRHDAGWLQEGAEA